MSELLVTFAGLATIAAIVWWFWFSEPKAAFAVDNQTVEILVQDGVYQPAVIEVQAGQPLTLRFIRHDAAPCAEKVVFGNLGNNPGISTDLPIGKPQTIKLEPLQPGIYEFTCQMGMYRGKLIAK